MTSLISYHLPSPIPFRRLDRGRVPMTKSLVIVGWRWGLDVSLLEVSGLLDLAISGWWWWPDRLRTWRGIWQWEEQRDGGTGLMWLELVWMMVLELRIWLDSFLNFILEITSSSLISVTDLELFMFLGFKNQKFVFWGEIDKVGMVFD